MKREKTIAVEMSAATLAGFDAILDARSPAEHAEDHVPGAISTPVLDNEERARVGAVYAQASPFDAKKLGAALVARNIARHLETLCADQPRGWRPLVYCWRGGKRSGAFAHVLREVGWDARSLQGGYKAYRQWAVQELARQPARLSFRVICGPTGSGKSRLLRELAAAGAQVLDLEALAAHRGSVLGNLPGAPQPAQKMFESRVLHLLSGFDAARPVFVEAESKKIGQLQVPDALIARMRASECLRVEASMDTRVALLTDEYRHFVADRALLEAQLDCLVALHGRERIEAWKAVGAAGDWPVFVRRLLEEHYDPAYRRSSDRNYARLGEARAVPLPGADDASFENVAKELAAHALSACTTH